MSRVWLALGIIFMVVGCRTTRTTNATPETGNTGEGASANPGSSSNPPSSVQPQNQNGTQISQSLNVTFGSNGTVNEHLAIRLDYIPAANSNGVNAPACNDQIGSGVVVGRLSCNGSGNRTVDVTANQVNQVCYTSNPVRKIVATGVMTLMGCNGSGVLQVFKFNPDIKVEIAK